MSRRIRWLHASRGTGAALTCLPRQCFCSTVAAAFSCTKAVGSTSSSSASILHFSTHLSFIGMHIFDAWQPWCDSHSHRIQWLGHVLGNALMAKLRCGCSAHGTAAEALPAGEAVACAVCVSPQEILSSGPVLFHAADVDACCA